MAQLGKGPGTAQRSTDWAQSNRKALVGPEPRPILFLTERINISIHDQKPQELLWLP